MMPIVITYLSNKSNWRHTHTDLSLVTLFENLRLWTSHRANTCRALVQLPKYKNNKNWHKNLLFWLHRILPIPLLKWMAGRQLTEHRRYSSTNRVHCASNLKLHTNCYPKNYFKCVDATLFKTVCNAVVIIVLCPSSTSRCTSFLLSLPPIQM